MATDNNERELFNWHEAGGEPQNTVWERAATGLKNYWYPVCGSRDVKQRWPTKLTRLGYDIAIVRRNGKPYAFLDECPHRGYTMHNGKYEFPRSNTITCRLHGMTFDLADRGKCVAVLTDGPDSPAVGKFRLRTFPVEERKGIIWVWFGNMAPVPIEEDVSTLIFEDDTLVKFRFRTVEGNWRGHAQQEAGHFSMLHRDTIGLLFNQIFAHTGGRNPEVIRSDDGGDYLVQQTGGPPIMRTEYPGLGQWPPKRLWRFMPRTGGTVPLHGVDTRGGSFRLPGTLRVINFPFNAAMLFEWYVAEDADRYTYFQLTCHWPRNPFSWLYTQIWYYLWGRPARKVRFNNQDKSAVAAQWRYWKKHGGNRPTRLYRPDAYNFALIDFVNDRARGEGTLWREHAQPRQVATESLPAVAGGSSEGPTGNP